MHFRYLFLCLFSLSLFSEEHVYLKTPNINRQDIIQTVVGVRPYRKTGIRLEPETIDGKLIIHNYGYGGSGLTLAFGGSHEVLDILYHQQLSSKIVAVLGGGVVGLTTAYDLLDNGYEVHMYAEDWCPNLTSNVAAGIWTPPLLSNEISTHNRDLYQKMLDISEKRLSMSISKDAEFSGVKRITGYRLVPSGYQEENQANVQGEEVVIHFDNGITKNGHRFIRLGLDGHLFIEDLFSKVKSKGAILEQRRFSHLEDILNLKESVIVNCMSLGSRELFNDQEFIPVRGQMIHLAPQEIDYAVFQRIPESDYFFFIYPWSDRLILGGVYEHGQEELKTTPEVIDQIFQNAEHCLFADSINLLRTCYDKK